MTRPAVLLAFWLLLCAAAPLPVADPPRPLLGAPFTVRLPLPPGSRLAGLPPLGALETVAPPRQEGDVLILYLMAMRTGEIPLPALPLTGEGGARFETSPLILSVSDGLPADAVPADLKELPSLPGTGRRWLWLVTGLAVPGLLLMGRWWLRRRNQLPVAAEPTLEERLANWQRRLAALPAPPPRAIVELHQEVETLRFGPFPVTDSELERLGDELTRVLPEGRS